MLRGVRLHYGTNDGDHSTVQPLSDDAAPNLVLVSTERPGLEIVSNMLPELDARGRVKDLGRWRKFIEILAIGAPLVKKYWSRN